MTDNIDEGNQISEFDKLRIVVVDDASSVIFVAGVWASLLFELEVTHLLLAYSIEIKVTNCDQRGGRLKLWWVVCSSTGWLKGKYLS